MKIFKNSILTVFAVSLFFIGCTSEPYTESNDVNRDLVVVDDIAAEAVTPVTIVPWSSGDAASECEQAGAGCDFSWKIDDSPENGIYNTNTDQYGNTPTDFDLSIKILNSDGIYFDWSTDYEVCAVIVKGGPGANVYYYPDGACSDTDLHAPINPANGTPYGLSHVTFCFSETPCDTDPSECFEDETAWADGERYTNRGNWATYTAYPGDGESVDIYAGKTNYAGTVTFNDNGDGTVDLDIALEDGFIFYYDMADDSADHNIKIQDYDTSPSGNPSPGLFDHKFTASAGASSMTVTVPMNEFYGIHLDVGAEVPCDG
ncbi:hypothetical protein [Gilvibacter sp.]|uniref:hypothetical protein n=1 Tax=Gilvibacter sp. TaxID=2729997 RepID=UPI0035BE8BBD